MFWRFLILFAGIVLMINGCNGLVSSQFGTHKLRTFTTEEALRGMGDADFVHLTDAVVGESFIVGPALRVGDTDYILRPLFSPAQAAAHQRGEKVSTGLIGWYETRDPACTEVPVCPPPAAGIRGLLSKPTERKNPVEKWTDQRIELSEEVRYLQIGEQPLAWYWNLLFFVGGIGIAIAAEYVNHLRSKREADNARPHKEK